MLFDHALSAQMYVTAQCQQSELSKSRQSQRTIVSTDKGITPVAGDATF
jgi:hypothetical protein